MELALILFASFTLETILAILVKLIIAGLIAYVLFWALGRIGLPEPFAKIALVLLVLAVAAYVISLLLPYA